MRVSAKRVPGGALPQLPWQRKSLAHVSVGGGRVSHFAKVRKSDPTRRDRVRSLGYTRDWLAPHFRHSIVGSLPMGDSYKNNIDTLTPATKIV